MAWLIDADSFVSYVHVDHTPTRDELETVLKGKDLKKYHVGGENFMLVNGEGDILGLEYNNLATQILLSEEAGDDIICGIALIFCKDELKPLIDLEGLSWLGSWE